MYIIALGWIYVVMVATIATALDPNGGWLLAIFIALFAGALPLALLFYMAGRGRRQQLRQEAQNAEQATTQAAPTATDASSGPVVSAWPEKPPSARQSLPK